jgi:hypothetical protein
MTNLMRRPYRVPRVEKPRAEGRFYLPTGRRLGFAEFGDPAGDPVLRFHGTPGGRRQFPLLGRRAAEEISLRVVAVGRPGTGLSDPHPYESVADWASDVAHVADSLGAAGALAACGQRARLHEITGQPNLPRDGERLSSNRLLIRLRYGQVCDQSNHGENGSRRQCDGELSTTTSA